MAAVADPKRDALAALRRARRSNRAAEVDVFDAFYQAYLTAIGCGVAVLVASDVVGDKRVDASQLAHVVQRGPQLLGVAVALLAVAGLRSGVRGGPLVLPAADVRYVLLAPIDRGDVLRGPAARQVRFAAFVGIVVGAAGGVLASHRLPGGLAAWAVCGAAAGLLSAVLASGCALVASGMRLGRWVAGSAGVVLVAWTAADVVGRTRTSPATVVGVLAMWPARFRVVGIAAVVLPLAVAGAGVAAVGGSSVEAAERRASLASQIRFALTLQDLRTVVLLRRQLNQEHPRSRPWVPTPAISRGRTPAWRRDLRGIARWPGSRLLRLLVLGAIAGVALTGVWTGTTPLVVVAALALYLAGLDALEPLAQDIDHPDRAASVPLEPGQLRLRHVPASMAALALVVLVGWAAALAVAPSSAALPVGAALLLPAALLATAGAATSIVMGPPAASDNFMLPVEAAGIKMVLRVLWAPALVAVGLTPLLIARSASHRAVGPVAPGPAAVSGSVLPVLVGIVALGWLRFREDLHRWMTPPQPAPPGGAG